MGDKSKIEWTDASWNPVTGCTKVSAGCDHCYADTLARGRLAEVYSRRLPVVDDAEHRSDPFAVRLWPERMDQPQRWTRPRMIFVNSMSDLFHAHVPAAYVRECFKVMLTARQHTYQVLTKRPSRMQRFAEQNADLWEPFGGTIPEWIWMGTSVENQEAAFRIRQLWRVKATTLFLSCEPLIGPLDIAAYLEGDEEHGAWPSAGRTVGWTPPIGWVIVGGESGDGHRPCDPAWVRSLRDQCVSASVPFFFKQWGGRTPKSGGRILDGRVWDEFPATLERRA